MFSKTYELSLTRAYVSAWGMEQAVRELIQNAIDSDSPFVYEFSQEPPDGWTLRLNSEFAKLDPKTLLLGATSKAGNRECIGSFGEGYKLALLVLERAGHKPEVHNGDLLWRPEFQYNSRFGEELLVIRESRLTDRTNKGLTFVVRNMSQSHVDAIRSSCLQMQGSIGERKQTKFGDILLDKPHEHRLYVGGLLVCETTLAFGYNVKPEFLRLERDRQTVSDWDLKRLTCDMWFETGEYARIAQMIKDEVPDLEYAEYSSPEIVKQACYELFRKQHPGAIAVRSQDELKQLVEDKLVKTVVVSSAYHSNITRSSGYMQEPKPIIQTPTERLEKWFGEAKYHMHDKVKASFRKLIAESKEWTIR